MRLYKDIPKKRRSTITTENGAILDAKMASITEWMPDGDCTGVELLSLRRELRAYLNSELREGPHRTMADLRASGLFSRFSVESRRGYWRVLFS